MYAARGIVGKEKCRLSLVFIAQAGYNYTDWLVRNFFEGGRCGDDRYDAA